MIGEPFLTDDKRLPPNYEDIKDTAVWRVISARHKYGHWEYLFEDYVLTTSLGEYLITVTWRGAQRITLHRIGPFKEAFGSKIKRPMRGTTSIARERKNNTIDMYQEC